VNLPNNTRKTDLTLSAVGELEPAFSGALTTEPGFPRVLADPHCPECLAHRPHVAHRPYADPRRAVQSERDPVTPELEREKVSLTESEQRALWGDR
jgi:hypothetical protein